MSQVGGEFLFFYAQEVLGARLYQTEVAKTLHKDTDPLARCADHLRQFLVCNPVLDAQAIRALLAKCASQLQQGFPQTMLAIQGHQMSDDLPLFCKTHSQVADESLK